MTRNRLIVWAAYTTGMVVGWVARRSLDLAFGPVEPWGEGYYPDMTDPRPPEPEAPENFMEVSVSGDPRWN